MFDLKEYCRVRSLEQADHLLHENKKNVILGGLLWMRMGTRQFHTGIDLSGLGLDRIEDKGDRIEIGCMTCLRQLETSELLQNHIGPVITQAVSPIVGVQFRNLATVGGSVFSRFSFSDVITALLVLDTWVHLYRGGIITLETFLETSPGRDILVRLSIPKQNVSTTYRSIRRSATDFPVLTAAFARGDAGWKIALGARPARAKAAVQTAALLSENPDAQQLDRACRFLIDEMTFGSNQRGGKSYREHLAQVLVKRGIQDLCD